MSWDAGTTAASANVPDVVRASDHDDPNTLTGVEVGYVRADGLHDPGDVGFRTGARAAGALI